MPLTKVNTIPSGVTTYAINASNQIWTLASGASINSNSIGIFEWSDYHDNTINVNGSILAAGGNAGIDSFGAGTSIHIGAAGTVNGFHGIRGFGEHFKLVNEGTLIGSIALLLGGDHSQFVNKADVHGRVVVDNTAGQTARIVNYGTFHDPNQGFIGSVGREILVNHGTISGFVSLGDGNDVFDNRGGNVGVIVSGNDGNDTYIIGSLVQITELAGEGTDTVKSTVNLNLRTNHDIDNQEIENLVLLGKKNLNGTGNDLDNAIRGNSGDNRLSGGLGSDSLTGGKGADIFVFKTGFGHDKVTDLGRDADRIDLSDLNGATTFANLMAHHVSKSGDNIVIHFGTDHLTLEHTAKSDLQASDFIF